MEPQTYLDGQWHEGNPPVLGPMTLSTWLGAVVFDGARAFDGALPDLDLHCQRVCQSALNLGMKSPMEWQEIERICREGVTRFPEGTHLYLKPIIWAEDGWIYPDPNTSRIMINLFEAPLPEPTGFSICISNHRRPAPDQAPTDAKAACLYPNAGRALREATELGYDNAVMLDPIGNVAEFCTANLFMAKNGIVSTPSTNGTFLNGITRQRVLSLLREDGASVEERAITVGELRDADEIWSTGNHAKVVPVTRIEDRVLQPGPHFSRARELYFEYARKSV